MPEFNIDISQTPVLKKFARYLKLENRNPEIISRIEEGGFCVGFTVMAVFGKYLELEKSTSPFGINFLLKTDDWPWMRTTLRNLMLWDGSAESLNMPAKRYFKKDIERLFTLIRQFQDLEILGMSSQVCTDLYLNDVSDRKFIREYSIAGIIDKAKFLQPLKILYQNKVISTNLLTEVIKEKRLVLVSTYDHILGIIKHKNKFCFYDSNIGEWKIFVEHSLEMMLWYIFNSDNNRQSNQIAVGIYSLCETSLTPKNYLPQEILLKEIINTNTLRSSCKYQITHLFIAVDANCLASVQFHLKNPPIPLQHYLDLICTPEAKSALRHAVFLNHYNIVEELVHAGANVNLACGQKKTPLAVAIVSGYDKLAKFLLKNHADPNIPDKNRMTPLDFAIVKNNLPMVKLLVQYKCNLNLKTYQNISFFLKAILLKKYDIAKFLIFLPQISIAEDEYDKLSDFYKTNHHNPELQVLTNKIYFVVILQKIKSQIGLMQLKDKTHYHAAKRMLALTLGGLNLNNCENSDISQLIASMLPILKKGSAYTMGLWSGSKPIEELVALIEKFDINHRKFMP